MTPYDYLKGIFKPHKGFFDYSSINHAAIEGSAAVTSAAAYHPLKTIATQLVTGSEVRLTFRSLYRGFWATAGGAHQLFLMGFFERQLTRLFFENNEEPTLAKRVMIGTLAGMLTTPTATPFEMAAVQKQLKRSFDLKNGQLFRGFIPMAFRQAGLGAGMFILPSLLFNKVRQIAPSVAKNHERSTKLATCFLGGSLTATATQVFEIARLLMQEDAKREKYSRTSQAIKAAIEQMKSPKGRKTYAIRLGIVATATMAMNTSREFYQNCFGGKD